MWENQTTKNIFFRDGEYNGDRKILHNDIVRMFIADKGLNNEVNDQEAILLGADQEQENQG